MWSFKSVISSFMLSKETNPTVYDIATTISNSLVIAQEVNKLTKLLDDKNDTSFYSFEPFLVKEGLSFVTTTRNFTLIY